MAKPFQRVILLVLASDNAFLYKQFRKIYKAYANTDPSIKTFMVYAGKENSFTPDEHDLVYSDIEENYYPGMITKTVRAMEDIDKQYDYDFMIRTNLSTFWDFELLHKRLDKQPITKCFTGTFRDCVYKGKPSPQYVSGTNLVVSRDLVKTYIKNSVELCSWDLPEDWALSQLLINRGYKPKASFPGAIHRLDTYKTIDEKVIMSEIEKARDMRHDNFRIKNPVNRDVIDVGIAKILLREYYGKEIL